MGGPGGKPGAQTSRSGGLDRRGCRARRPGQRAPWPPVRPTGDEATGDRLAAGTCQLNWTGGLVEPAPHRRRHRHVGYRHHRHADALSGNSSWPRRAPIFTVGFTRAFPGLKGRSEAPPLWAPAPPSARSPRLAHWAPLLALRSRALAPALTPAGPGEGELPGRWTPRSGRQEPARGSNDYRERTMTWTAPRR